ncbi:adenylate/guanylate cyclase domain-containing protein [Actinomadura rayongensis]|uniref:Adenylate/guanylate cyclase domain-containing protein n=1 Tax=Actinomadura rayongensis TaxID=1429076 RepID=A0A6I4W7N6_9ACTN|nr:adenylate/guanylate cyclase domain-containing protein [Actinomadura rayongensis]MXQ65303.1 adenylate/guanylate cyclase domain-containing protein [Actinomadura rayongensis]
MAESNVPGLTAQIPIEETLLGGPLRYTRKEVEALADVDEEYARRIWQALGFPTPPDDETAFTDGDVDALREIRKLLENDLVDEEMVVQLSRAVGQTMGRLASWLADVWVRRLSEEWPEDEPITAEIVSVALEATSELEPAFERLMLHGWRRQLAEAALRTAAATVGPAAADPTVGVSQLTVGFADVVSFTRMSRRMDGGELAEFVERFERVAAEVIAEQGGRVIKTLGDEVLYAATDPAAAVEIGLRIAELCDTDPSFPRVRVGIAYGEVLQRLGDVFGTPVNLAARLTAIAYPGTVVVDGQLARAIKGAAGYDVSTLRSRPVQGLGKVRPRVVRRRTARS